MLRVCPFVVLLALALLTPVASAATEPSPGLREVLASDRDVLDVSTRLRATTLLVLPEDDEVLEVICGDRDFWVVHATHHLVHIKPAKARAETTLHVVTSRTIYTFRLREIGPDGVPDLTVTVRRAPPAEETPPTFYSAAQMATLTAQLAEARLARETAEAAVHQAHDRAGQIAADAGASARREYATQLRFVYETPPYDRPFYVRAIWHDGQFTYVQTDAPELPALYELQDGQPAVVPFQVQDGVYIVPKVLDRAYFALGRARLTLAPRSPR